MKKDITYNASLTESELFLLISLLRSEQNSAYGYEEDCVKSGDNKGANAMREYAKKCDDLRIKLRALY